MYRINKEKKFLPCRRGHSSDLWKDNLLIVFGGIKGFNKYLNELVEINLEVIILN